MNSDRVWKVQFPKSGWMSLMVDNPDTGCVAIVTNTCLESSCCGGRDCQSYREQSAKKPVGVSFLETKIVVDDHDNPPKGLSINGQNWTVAPGAVKSVYSLPKSLSRGVEVMGFLSDATTEVGGLRIKTIEVPLILKRKRFVYEFSDNMPDARPLPALVQ